jgi:hypothetical protein
MAGQIRKGKYKGSNKPLQWFGKSKRIHKHRILILNIYKIFQKQEDTIDHFILKEKRYARFFW